MPWGRTSVARQLLLLQVVMLGLMIAAGTAAAYLDAGNDADELARMRVLDVAETVARSPEVLAGLRERDAAKRLQLYAESVRLGTGMDFVVIMTTEGIRYTHPTPARIGGTFIGTIKPAVAGQPLTETFTGTLGPSIRAVVPVPGDGAPVEGLVSVGITTEKIGSTLTTQIPALLAACALALVVALAGSWLISVWLRRMTLGLGPAEITSMYEHHDAVLHNMREGLLVLDRHRRLRLVNDEARRLLGLAGNIDDRHANELDVPGPLKELLASGRVASDEIHLTDDAVLVVNQAEATRNDRRLGTVTTLRDHTDLLALTGELDSVRGFAEALRAQAHEAANRLHTVVTMIELGRAGEAAQFATEELASTQRLADRMHAEVEEPVLAALLLGKITEAHERGVELVVTPDTAMGRVTGLHSRDLVTLVGNLIDNAVDAALAASSPRRVAVTVRHDGTDLLIRISDSGRGIDPERLDDVFAKGWSTKSPGRGLGLALVRQVISRKNGTINVQGSVFEVRLPAAEVVT